MKWSLNEDILKINDSDYQYAVSIKENTAYLCLHSPKTTKETSSIPCIQRRPIRRIEDIVCEDSGRYQAWSYSKKPLIRPSSRWLTNEPTGLIKTWEDPKTKFLNKYCPPGRTAKKMEEIKNFQQEPDETLYHAWERFKELLMKCPQHYLTEMQEVILFYNGLDIPTRLIQDSRAIQAQLNNLGREIKKVNEKVYAAQVGCGGYRATAPGFYQRNNANPSYQERRQSMEDTLRKFMGESAKRHEENSNLIKEIRASTDAAIQNQGASIKTLEIQIGKMSKVMQERGFGSLPSSTETNPRDQVKLISITIEANSYPIRRIGSSQYVVSTGQNRTLMYETRQMTIPFLSHLNSYYCKGKKGSYGPQFLEAYSEASHINNSIPRKEKDRGNFTLPCFINNVCFDNAFVDLGASVSVIPLSTYLNLGLGKLAHTKLTVELANRTVKYPKGIAENLLVGIGKFTFPVDFIILDMPEDIKVPLIL
ncbi:mitochondrial proton/calcium exchanger protein-like protein isoform X1, partial [Tanacetum coccineum]